MQPVRKFSILLHKRMQFMQVWTSLYSCTSCYAFIKFVYDIDSLPGQLQTADLTFQLELKD